MLPLVALVAFLTEMVVFIQLGERIGFGPTLLSTVLASVAGLVLVRREGLRAWRRFRHAVTAGEPPGPRVTDGLVGLGGALLLATPGLVTGAAGLVVLIPPVRRLAGRRVRERAERQMPSGHAAEMFGPRRVRVWQHAPSPDPRRGPDQVVEGEVLDPPAGRPGQRPPER
jgi:UPF0716 protein FxsA